MAEKTGRNLRKPAQSIKERRAEKREKSRESTELLTKRKR
ncbi:hypothetical protein ABIB34_002106 [Rhodococcus sp. UYP5]